MAAAEATFAESFEQAAAQEKAAEVARVLAGTGVCRCGLLTLWVR